MLRLTVSDGTDEWVFGFPQAEVVVGAARASALVLDHEAVAARHAKFTQERDGVVATSLDQARPLKVNHRYVGRLAVREGDIIEVGPYRLGVLDRDPPGKVEKSFLDAIAEAPQDDTPRAIYGDWLEETGRFEEARFLRAQLEVRGLEANHERFRELSRTIMELAPKMPLTWRRAVARPAIENCHFELKCPKTWDELETTDQPDERWCDACDRKVFFAGDIVRARDLALRGACVAVDLVVPRRARDLYPEPPRMLGAIAPPPPPRR